MRSRKLKADLTPRQIESVRAGLGILDALAAELFPSGMGYETLQIARAAVQSCLASWTGEASPPWLPTMRNFYDDPDMPVRPQARHLDQIRHVHNHLVKAVLGLHPSAPYYPPMQAALVAVRYCAVDWSGRPDYLNTANADMGRYADKPNPLADA